MKALFTPISHQNLQNGSIWIFFSSRRRTIQKLFDYLVVMFTKCIKRYELLAVLFTALVLPLNNSFAQDEYSSDQELAKKIDNIYLRMALEDIAYMDIVQIAGPPSRSEVSGCTFLDTLRNNQLKFWTYVFFPNKIKKHKKYPLLVFPHGGIHGNMGTSYIHNLREMILQGYIVVCPDYRGSTGYGKSFYEAIDYGGLENEDVLAARDYAVENYSNIDPARVGIIGWSHGGMISLMNLLKYPDKYVCAYAGVPVCDVTYRIGYLGKSYLDLFTPPFHVGCTPEENPEEYRRRSPVTYAHCLKRPLMITTCLNDDDVSHTEVERMIDSLKFHNKSFDYKIYPAMGGAHMFERIDSKEASDIRFDTYKFLERYLNPPYPFKNKAQLRKAGYKFN